MFRDEVKKSLSVMSGLECGTHYIGLFEVFSEARGHVIDHNNGGVIPRTRSCGMGKLDEN